MKLGIAGCILPPDWHNINVDAARRVRSAGFLGASLIIYKPLEADPADIRRVKQAFDDAGLEVAQANGWYECLVNPDESIRAQGVRGLQALTRIGRQVNAPTVYVRPGSLNPNGHWYGHPDNHSLATFDRLVDSMRQVCSTAEMEGMTMAIEGHVLSPLDTPQRVRDLFKAVASPALKFNIDAVNFISTVRDTHDTTRTLTELFDVLGDSMAAGHAKDCKLGDALVVHIEEAVVGAGTINYPLLLRRFEQCCPNGYMLIEHLSDAQVPQAREAFVRFAAQVGVPLKYEPG